MSNTDQKPTAEQVEFAEKLGCLILFGEGDLTVPAITKVKQLITTRDVMRDLAVEAAAYKRVRTVFHEQDLITDGERGHGGPIELCKFCDTFMSHFITPPRTASLATRDLAVEAAARFEAIANCNHSPLCRRNNPDVCDTCRERDRIPSLTTALAAHDRELTARLVAESCSNPNVVKEVLREREDRMLKRFEDLAGKWSTSYTFNISSDGQARIFKMTGELSSTIASIRKERSNA